MKTRILILLIAALTVLPFAAIPAPAAEKSKQKDSSPDARMEELKKQFQERFPQIQELKKAGIVGETYDGYIAVREGGDDKASKLVDQENADRRELYQLIAKKEGIAADVVALRAGKRNFEKAKPGEWLKGEDGSWKKK